jgi:hypothetical protein
VNDGTRTRDIRHHKPALYQLSYAHHASGVATGPPEVYRNLQPSVSLAKSATTCAAAACASSDVGPGRGAKTVAR